MKKLLFGILLGSILLVSGSIMLLKGNGKNRTKKGVEVFKTKAVRLRKTLEELQQKPGGGSESDRKRISEIQQELQNLERKILIRTNGK